MLWRNPFLRGAIRCTARLQHDIQSHPRLLQIGLQMPPGHQLIFSHLKWPERNVEKIWSLCACWPRKLLATWWPCQYLQVFYPANSR